MQTAMQAAFAGLVIPKKTVSIPVKPAAKAAGPRRVPFGTFDIPMKLAPVEGLDRVSESREPPEHESNFAERYFSECKILRSTR